MSMDLFLTCTRDGPDSAFSRSVFEDVMGRGAIDPEFPLSEVRYGDGSGCLEIDGGEADSIASLSFNRFGGETFYDRLWELADRTDSYLAWPRTEGCPFAVTRTDMIAKLDPSIVSEFGTPVVARSGKELADAIEEPINPDDEDDFEDE